MKRILLLLASAAFLALPDWALARSDDKSYCTQVADLYRRYVHTSPGWGSDVEAAHALDACRNGDPKGLAVLEKKLQDNGITLPGREFKP